MIGVNSKFYAYVRESNGKKDESRGAGDGKRVSAVARSSRPRGAVRVCDMASG